METRTEVFVKTGLFALAVMALAALVIAVGAKAADRALSEARHSHRDFRSGEFRSGGALRHFR
jgi:hypothetical protein